ncbi:universal stress protein [Flagellimonas sp. S174]|uniref:universal stress protein n=1 Tax=Flagellimonas sp. S174 TaxID=3410790 RepID=UPI003BF482E6
MLNILLPTDFSENAQNAIEYGLQLYKDTTCVFHLMHVYTPAIYRIDYALGSPGQIGFPDDYKYYTESRLEKKREEIEAKFNNPRHTFIIHSAFNHLVDEISEMVENKTVDLVIMGTQGATGAKEIFLGSNAVHVIKKSKAPVLVIPQESIFKAPKNILLPTDFEIDYNLTDIHFLRDVMKLHGSKLHIMHVAVPKGLTAEQEKNKTVLFNKMKGTDYVYHNLPDQELIEAINSYETEHNIELLTMVRNKHTFMERIFIEPTIKKIGFHTIVPFMVLPYHN